MLFLVCRRVEPFWSNGHVSIALSEGIDKEDAIAKAMKVEKSKTSMGDNEDLRGEFTAVALDGGFVKIGVLED